MINRFLGFLRKGALRAADLFGWLQNHGVREVASQAASKVVQRQHVEGTQAATALADIPGNSVYVTRKLNGEVMNVDFWKLNPTFALGLRYAAWGVGLYYLVAVIRRSLQARRARLQAQYAASEAIVMEPVPAPASA